MAVSDDTPESMSAAGRLESALGHLVLALELINAGVNGAERANAQLLGVAAQVRQVLTSKPSAREGELKEQLRLLEAKLADERTQAKRDRDYIIEDQDNFLAVLLEEHEEAISALRQERDALRSKLEEEGKPSPGQKLTPLDVPTAHSGQEVVQLRRKLAEAERSIENLTAERQRSRTTLRRLQMQRDEAQRKVQRLTGRSSRPAMAASPEADSLHTAWDNEPPSPPPSSEADQPVGQSAPPGHATPPPEELRAAVLTSTPPPADRRPPAAVPGYRPAATDGGYSIKEAESKIEKVSLPPRPRRR